MKPRQHILAFPLVTSPGHIGSEIIRSFSASTSELVRGLSRYESRTSVYISHVQGVSLSGHDYHDSLVG